MLPSELLALCAVLVGLYVFPGKFLFPVYHSFLFYKVEHHSLNLKLRKKIDAKYCPLPFLRCAAYFGGSFRYPQY